MYRRICLQSARSISLFRILRAKSFYDSLEITSNATQAEIKEAYYKLSMMYHPDKNTGSEASAKFRDISEAYEVLRNVRLRKLYDKGLFLNRSSTIQEEEVDKFYQSRQHRSKPPPPSGKTPIYDFDEWSRSHYGATLARDLERKRRRMREAATKIENIEDIKKEKVFFCAFILVILGGYLFYRTEDYDQISDQFAPKRR